MIKEMKYHANAREATTRGIKQVCEMVINTYGPKGSNVLIENDMRGLLITDKSHKIIHNFKLPDLYEDTGAQLAIEAIENTGDLAGDGTTLTALLILQMIKDGELFITQGISPARMRRGLKIGLEKLKEELTNMRRPIDDQEQLKAVVKSACQEEKTANIVIDAMTWVGEKGIILTKEEKKTETWLEKIDGIQLKHGYLSQRFCKNTEEKQILLDHPYILITDKKITNFTELLPILEKIVEQNRPLLIIADQVEGEALTLLLENNQKKVFKVVAVKADGVKDSKKDFLQDIGVATAGRVIRQETGETFQNVSLFDLGQAESVTVFQDKTTIIGGQGEAWKIKQRIAEIEEIMKDDHTTQHDQEVHRERIGKLQNKIAIIHLGAISKLQLKEQNENVQNAIKITRAAYYHGIVPGGGVTLVKLSQAIRNNQNDMTEEENAGLQILQNALLAPIAQLAKGCLLIPQQVIEYAKTEDQFLGVDVEHNTIADMEQNKIYDASDVLQTAIEQAVSFLYEWLDISVLMVSTAPDREDIELLKQGVPIMR